MKEIDYVQAVATWINLSYTAGQWWITLTTALLVATYFAARHTAVVLRVDSSALPSDRSLGHLRVCTI